MDYQTPKPYLEDTCKQCGTCLQRCPIMHLTEEQSIKEIKNLREGRNSVVLKRCTSCLDCDFFCPNGCNPGELILNRWAQINRDRKLPERARYFLPHSRPNFRTYVMERMSPREKGIIRSWDNLAPAKEVCYPGCNMIVTPLLTQTAALEGLDIRGSLEYCCGEMYWRMGLFDQVRQVAKKTQAFFEALGAEKVTILCTAGLYVFTEVLPHFGAEFNFEIESYLHLIKRRLDSGELEFKHPVNMRVAVQDSCYGKQFGADYMDIPREILTRAGAEVVEMEASRECMMCCGIGSGFSPYSAYHPMKLTTGTMRTMHNAKKSGADALVAYCSGCLQMFSTGQLFYRWGLPTYHLLEVISMALGETEQSPAEMARSHRRLAWKAFAGTARNQFPKLLTPRRFRVPDVDTGIDTASSET